MTTLGDGTQVRPGGKVHFFNHQLSDGQLPVAAVNLSHMW
jgi:hypothetical protein